MGLYGRYIAPRLADMVCRRSDIAAERAALIPRAEGVVVEIGIGTGLNLPYYDKAKVRRVYGIDPGEGFLNLGRERFTDSPVLVTIMTAPAEAIPLPNDSADSAVMTYTLCSVVDPIQALREVRRVLKPGGALYYLEHGRSEARWVARGQDLLNEAWKPLACGCNLNRDVPILIAKAGFLLEETVRFDLAGAPRLIGTHIRGVARKGPSPDQGT
jgi:ubiquinone/menaquinone biosynthesis C-methylase UbiE